MIKRGRPRTPPGKVGMCFLNHKMQIMQSPGYKRTDLSMYSYIPNWARMVRDYKRGNPVIRAVKQPLAMAGWSSPTSTGRVLQFTKTVLGLSPLGMISRDAVRDPFRSLPGF